MDLQTLPAKDRKSQTERFTEDGVPQRLSEDGAHEADIDSMGIWLSVMCPSL